MNSKTRLEQEESAELRDSRGKMRELHANHTVKQKEGALQMLPKYVQCTGMQRGALGERNKDSTVSGSLSLSPVLPHPHIISWKIPDICCNFFLPPLLLFLLPLLVLTGVSYPDASLHIDNMHKYT